uniref:Tryptophan synthase beta chain-like PALP domain-containing protein n=1 Tax=Rhodosorus marinus TaxID=101924 RepID=A0A7S3A3Y5_9RHOD|mmetsp:Transcript_41743/g.163803  ORF Transcript_41743/g.163803 Transcript_41743/m.163803 type:complete len:323 (+) Transcript_41743:142-1110(+)
MELSFCNTVSLTDPLRQRAVEVSCSPIETVSTFGREILVKRDDSLIIAPRLGGNKVRKLHHLIHDTSTEAIVSYGSAQGNTMAALASLCKMNGREFVYYTATVPRFLRDKPSGNFKFSLDSGMELRIVPSTDNITPLQVAGLSSFHFVPLGAAYQLAEEGVKVLARELIEQLKTCERANVRIVVASGTGTLALFLERYLRLNATNISVVAAPVVGDAAYLVQQMQDLDKRSGDVGIIPAVLDPMEKKPFAKPRKELLEIWKELSAQGLNVDLIYGARVWEILLEQPEAFIGNKDITCVYYHCGGLDGDSSQLSRYKRLGLVK